MRTERKANAAVVLDHLLAFSHRRELNARAEEQPDVVCLQELKAPQERFPETAIRDLGYDAIWHGQKNWNGVAILSRVGEIQETRRGLP